MNETASPQTLNAQFGIPDALHFEQGPGDLTRAVITGPAASGTVYLHGGHITSYQPKGQKDVIFFSRKSHFDAQSSFRGGVPVCFPWFGMKQDDPAAPMHGLARLQPWTVAAARQQGEQVVLELSTTVHPFTITHRIGFGPTLSMAATVTNQGDAPASYELALHTYFAVGDIRQAEVQGLEGCEYLDKPSNFARLVQPNEPIRFTGETDRVYLDNANTTTLRDPANGRQIVISKHHSSSTVVWNPWINKAAAMPDFGDDEWTDMLCIETANVAKNRIELAPGQSHTMTAEVRAEAL